MKHDKLFLVRILCLIGIAGELLIPNNIIRMLFGLFFAIISVALLLMHKNDIILEESDRKTNYSISIICISVILLLFIIVGYIILKELRVIVLSDSQEIFLSEILVFGFMAIFGNCSKKLPFNKYVGLRLPWTLDDCQTWRYAHRCWGWINFVLGIILVILSIFILILTKDDTNFEMISVYLVFLQLGIMVLTIIPTEFLLHKHFTKQGMKK